MTKDFIESLKGKIYEEWENGKLVTLEEIRDARVNIVTNDSIHLFEQVTLFFATHKLPSSKCFRLENVKGMTTKKGFVLTENGIKTTYKIY